MITDSKYTQKDINEVLAEIQDLQQKLKAVNTIMRNVLSPTQEETNLNK